MSATKKRVLICDDDPLMRKLLNRLLSSIGCDVVGEAEDGDGGVRLFKELKPDLTLMDISMPGKNGVDALAGIMKANSEAVVVMLSAMDDTTVAESCLHKGALGYIKKGTDMGELQAALGEFI